MIYTDGERFEVFSASGELLKEVGSFIQIYNFMKENPDKVFDLDGEKATIRGVHTDFEMEFDGSFQPQHARDKWAEYNNFPKCW